MTDFAARLRARSRAARILALVSAAAALPALAGSLPKARPEDLGFSSERLGRIHEAVQRHIDAGEVAGAVTLVARRGRSRTSRRTG